jgi:hypothetical protein
MILESNWLQHADEHRGRFRSFLLKSVQNFLNHTHAKEIAQLSGAVRWSSFPGMTGWRKRRHSYPSLPRRSS